MLFWFDSDNAPDTGLIGRKAAKLWSLTRNGFRCPFGCCLTVEAWRLFRNFNHLSLEPIFDRVPSPEIVGFLRKEVAAGRFPPEISKALRIAWDTLAARATWKPVRLAVRSSGIAEDLAMSSFAGQYTTTLNVRNFAALEHAVKTCWASILNDHALAYQRTRARGTAQELAVIIQELVPAVSAGIAFSANPVTGRRDEIHIDANWGLGETVVAGRVTPDHFIVRSADGSPLVTQRRIRRKIVATNALLDGGLEVTHLGLNKAESASLNDSQVIEVAAAVQQIATLFGGPQDVEWAIANNTLFILQARPIAAIPSPIDEGINWTFIVKKRLSWLSEMIQVEGIGRQYYQESLGLDFEFRNARMVRFYEYLDTKELSALSDLLQANQREDPYFLDKLATQSYRLCDELSAFTKELAILKYEQMATPELKSKFSVFVHHMLRLIPVIYTEPNLESNILDYLKYRLRNADETTVNNYFVTLTSTSKELTILREQRNLLQIAASIQERPELAQLVKTGTSKAIEEKLPPELGKAVSQHQLEFAWINTDDVYGHPWTIGEFLERIKYLVTTQDCKARLQNIIDREKERTGAYRDLLRELDPDPEFRRLLEAARTNSHLRTHRAEVYVRSMYEASALLTEVGRRLGLSYNDIVYFSHTELIGALEGSFKITPADVADRRDATAYIMINRKVGTFFGEDAWAIPADEGEDREKEAAGLIQGMTANGGKVTGHVKVVHDISELDKVCAGDVIVASMTIPEFVPAMERASAFVTDEGGITCHAAIISREMGVPCVIGTGNATKLLRDDDIVEVNASRGFVKLLQRG